MRWSVKKIKIKDLKPFVDNPRVISDKELKKLVESLKNQGNFKPLIVNKDLTILGGNQRYQALKAMGISEVEVSIPEKLLSKEEAKRIVLLDNTHSGEFDLNMLAEEFESAIKELDLGIELPSIEPEVKEDDFEEPEEKNIHGVQRGDIWQLGEHRLMCGDATSIDDVEGLMDGNKADMVFTDPPYGYSYESNHQSKHKQLLNDDKFLQFLPLTVSFSKSNSAHYICCGWQTSDIWREMIERSGLVIKNMIVWKKNNWSMGDLKGAYAGQHEIIWFAHKGRVVMAAGRDRDVWEFDRVPPSVHPTMKPVQLISKALKNHKLNIVLDVFGGSGSTLIACEQTNRKCYMMELDEHYCSVIIERWQNLTNKKAKKLN